MGRGTFGLVHHPRPTPIPIRPAACSWSTHIVKLTKTERKQLKVYVKQRLEDRNWYTDFCDNYGNDNKEVDNKYKEVDNKYKEVNEDEVNLGITRLVEACLNDLFKKKGPQREKALAVILQQFNEKHKFAETFVNKNFGALLYRSHDCFKSFTKKKSESRKKSESINEAPLASRVIAFMSLTLGCGEKANEILESTRCVFSEALECDSDSSVISCLMESLAIITAVGGNGTQDTERSMQIIWKFLQEKMVVSTERNTQVMISAISAWSFLLASIERWNISPTLWKGAVSYFCNLLGESNRFIRVVAAESLAHILETGVIYKFCDEEIAQKDHGSLPMQEFKERILDRVKTAVVETTCCSSTNSSGKVTIERHRGFSQDTIRFLKKGCRPDTSIVINKDELLIRSWSKLIQVEFMRWFLGSKFVAHVQKNELFQDFFDFVLTTRPRPNKELDESSRELDESSSEKEGMKRVYQPEISKDHPLYQRLCVSQNSIINKAKTQIMNKQRLLSEAKNAGNFSVNAAED